METIRHSKGPALIKRVLVTVILSLLASFSFVEICFGGQYPLWEIGGGITGLTMPDYRGSDEHRYLLLPFPYIIYRGDKLKVDGENVRGFLFKTDRIFLDVSGNLSPGVKSSDNRARQGMPDLDPTFEIGPSLEVIVAQNKEKTNKLSLSFPARAVFSTDFRQVIYQGWVFNPRVNLDMIKRDPRGDWNWGVELGPFLGNQGYHDYYYRVDPAFATPGRPAYSPQGGYSGLQLMTYIGKRYKRFKFNLFARTDFLNGAVFSNSPLLMTNTSILAGFAVSYLMWTSPTLVEAEK
ncbi:MAG TPA: MipA/OmpV family protein [Thermodesulfobacteriota bacterium]|nr:MipA/OmpV family protein [Thermodesulfobacteriota bacterium]